MQRISVLDGWRGLSIVLVLMTHWLPLRHFGNMGHLTGTAGMALFFCMSGYLMASILDKGISLKAFWARRAARIVPLAWLVILLCWPIYQFQAQQAFANILFVANLPPVQLVHPLKHLWSLCTEMQFYFFIGLAWTLAGRRSLPAIIGLYIVLVLNKVILHSPTTGSTLQRVDEIFAGFLLYFAIKTDAIKHVRALPWWLWSAGFLASCLEQAGPFNGFRSFFAAALVGLTVDGFQKADPSIATAFGWLKAKWLVYMASISYAVYVLHPVVAETWLGQGDLVGKYLKRPLLLLVVIALAHLSTKFFEPVATRWARRVR